MTDKKELVNVVPLQASSQWAITLLILKNTLKIISHDQ